MNEKMADSISKLIAKTNTFEKVESWLKGITLFMFIAGTASVYNSYKLYTLTKSIQSKEDKINKNLDKINIKLDKIIEVNEKIILLHQSKRNNENNTKEDDNTEFDINENNITEIETNVNKIEDYYEFVINN
jgi:hypothetical protein